MLRWRGSTSAAVVSSSSVPATRRSAMAAGEAERTQRAASSMASGTPSTSRQTRPTGGQVGGRAEPGAQQPGPVLEQPHGRVAGRLGVRPGRRVGQTGHLDQPFGPEPEPPPRGPEDLDARCAGE
jgi:hypothetical protein